MLELFNILTSHQQEPARLVIITNGIVTDIFRFNFWLVCPDSQEQSPEESKNCQKISKIWGEVERGSCLLLNFPLRGWTFVTFWTFTIFYELGVKPTCQSQNRNILWSKILPVQQYIQRYSLCVFLPHTCPNVPLKHITFSLPDFMYSKCADYNWKQNIEFLQNCQCVLSLYASQWLIMRSD